MKVTTDPAKMGRGPKGGKTDPETKSPAATHGPKKLPPKGGKHVQGRVKVKKVPFSPSKRRYASKIAAHTDKMTPVGGSKSGKDRNHPDSHTQDIAAPDGLVKTLAYRKAKRTKPVGKF